MVVVFAPFSSAGKGAGPMEGAGPGGVLVAARRSFLASVQAKQQVRRWRFILI